MHHHEAVHVPPAARALPFVRARMAARAQRRDLRVGRHRAVQDRDLQKLLERLAETSGGRSFFSEDPQKLEAIFAEIIESIISKPKLIILGSGSTA